MQSFFTLFGEHIYHILDRPEAITKAAVAVLKSFKDDGCMYLELRTTPRVFPGHPNSFQDYLDAVFAAIELNDESDMMVRLILTVNWDFEPEKVKEIAELAIEARLLGRCVVGIDIAGNPQKSLFCTERFFSEVIKARAAGLKLTIHFAEIPEQKPLLEKQLVALTPDRLGHAVFLTTEAQQNIVQHQLPIEICLTSNLRTGSIASVEEHHFRWAVKNRIPVLISTDDTLVFGTTLSKEYERALMLLNGDCEMLLQVVKDGVSCVFGSTGDKELLMKKIVDFECSLSAATHV